MSTLQSLPKLSRLETTPNALLSPSIMMYESICETAGVTATERVHVLADVKCNETWIF